MSLARLLKLSVVSLLFLLPACGGNKEPAVSSGPAPIKVAFISNNTHEFWKIAERGTMKAATEFGVEVEFKMPPGGGSPEDQRRFIDDLLVKGVQGIAICPNDAENQCSFLKETNEKVPLITQDSDVPDLGARRCYIGTNNVLAGMAVGELVKEAVPEGGELVIYVGKLDVQNAVERRQGVVVALAGGEDKCKEQLKQLDASQYPISFGKYTLLDTMTDGGEQKICREKVDDSLIKYPNVRCLVGLWAYNPPAMLEGVKAAKKEGKIALVGFDENEETLQGIKDGHIHGTVVQNPFMFGYESVKLLVGFVKKDPNVLKRDDIDAQGHIYVKHRVISKEKPKFCTDSKEHPWVEVGVYHAELKKLKGN